MKILSGFLSILMILTYHDDLYGQPQKSLIDSASLIQKKIKEDFKEVRKRKARQIKRIETEDSTIIFGADKKRTDIVHVSSYNRLEERHVQFTYNETGVILIGVLRRPKKVNGEEISQRKSAYYFDKGNLIHSTEKNASDDIAFLLSEADRYLKQGRRYLAANDL